MVKDGEQQDDKALEKVKTSKEIKEAVMLLLDYKVINPSEAKTQD